MASFKTAQPTFIANVYQPPEGNLENALSLIENKVLDICSDSPGVIIIMGDNIIYILDKNNAATKRYQNFLKQLNVQQLIATPTRVSNTKGSLLDCVLTTWLNRLWFK